MTFPDHCGASTAVETCHTRSSAAHSSDESEWPEWKTELDLNTKPGCFSFHIAKAILGLANRPFEVAARTCGGFGYVAVGVEPENLAGVEMPDPSQWIDRVEVYLTTTGSNATGQGSSPASPTASPTG